MGSRPSDVKGSAALQYTLKKQAGNDAMQYNKANSDRIVALKASGSFRVLLPTATWQRTTVAKWSNEVHQVVSFIGAEVVDEKGKRFPVRETLPVHARLIQRSVAFTLLLPTVSCTNMSLPALVSLRTT